MSILSCPCISVWKLFKEWTNNEKPDTFIFFYTPPHNNGMVFWFHIGCPCVSCASLYFLFPTITSVMSMDCHQTWYQKTKVLILRRSGTGLLMGKFRQFLTELSVFNTSVFSFPGDK